MSHLLSLLFTGIIVISYVNVCLLQIWSHLMVLQVYKAAARLDLIVQFYVDN